MVSHVIAQIGSRHLDSPPTTCHNTLFAKGLGASLWSSIPHTCAVCECRRGRHQQRRLWGPWRQTLAADAACRPADPLTIAVRVGGGCDGAQKAPFPTRHPRFHPTGGLAPRERACESGHTHTTRRQIIQDTILQRRGEGTHKKTPTRVWKKGIRRGAGTRRRSHRPRAGADPAAP